VAVLVLVGAVVVVVTLSLTLTLTLTSWLRYVEWTPADEPSRRRGRLVVQSERNGGVRLGLGVSP